MVSYKVPILGLFIGHASAHPPLPDCSIEKNKSSAECICRYPTNWNMEICQGAKWFNNFEIKINVGMQIIGGEEVPANTYPWFARATYGNGWGGCGGSLVSPEYVLTAAHCVHNNINNLEQNGGYQIGALCSPYGPNSSNNCNQSVQSFGINKITEHPSYNDGTLQNDFALVRLDGTSTISPVNMDPGNISPGYENLSSKGNLWPIGFGTMANGNVSSKLMHVNVNYVKQSSCNSAYGGSVTSDMLCAADNGQDSCQGDSGGPLYDSDNNALVGVVSWGIGCALPQYPGVYARVSEEITWIKNTICGAHGNPKPSFCGGPTPPTPTPPTPTPPTPTPPTPTPPSPSPPTCVDSPVDWHDSDGPMYDCDWYAQGDNCAQYGDMYENDGKTANEACCACGGGDTSTPTPPTPTPPSPTPPTPSPCGSGMGQIQLQITTDSFGADDNRLRVMKRVNGSWIKVWGVNQLGSSMTEEFEGCLDNGPNDKYKLIVIDSFGDGLCCEHGNGSYNVRWLGSIIQDSTFEDGQKEITKFGDGW